ncbi:hypothetical protein GCM10008983_26080 [Lentibacillus halophilus]|uniref:Methyltransferase n=1 Tax=Lentibacillus halophilus TaxID=295065 RepID=A0ABN0ZGD9_9BACI
MDNGLTLDTICGDALEEMKQMTSQSVDLIVTDPPYNLSKDYGTTADNLDFDAYLDFTRQWLREGRRILKDDGTIYVFMGVRYIAYMYMIMEQELGLVFNSWITWYYTQGIGKTKGFSPRHDDILMFTKSNHFNFYLDPIRIPQKYYRRRNNMRGANPGNVWAFSHVHYSNKNRQMHPTQKPEALFERMILASSKEGDTVLDPFVGSGTTLRVCQQTSRNGIGIDANHPYIDMTRQRLKQPFDGFDSMDRRLTRVPNDLNDKDVRQAYIQNHIQWFLTNHADALATFITAVKDKYAHKMDKEEMKKLDDLEVKNNGNRISAT